MNMKYVAVLCSYALVVLAAPSYAPIYHDLYSRDLIRILPRGTASSKNKGPLSGPAKDTGPKAPPTKSKPTNSLPQSLRRYDSLPAKLSKHPEHGKQQPWQTQTGMPGSSGSRRRKPSTSPPKAPPKAPPLPPKGWRPQRPDLKGKGPARPSLPKTASSSSIKGHPLSTKGSGDSISSESSAGSFKSASSMQSQRGNRGSQTQGKKPIVKEIPPYKSHDKAPVLPPLGRTKSSPGGLPNGGGRISKYPPGAEPKPPPPTGPGQAAAQAVGTGALWAKKNPIQFGKTAAASVAHVANVGSAITASLGKTVPATVLSAAGNAIHFGNEQIAGGSAAKAHAKAERITPQEKAEAGKQVAQAVKNAPVALGSRLASSAASAGSGATSLAQQASSSSVNLIMQGSNTVATAVKKKETQPDEAPSDADKLKNIVKRSLRSY